MKFPVAYLSLVLCLMPLALAQTTTIPYPSQSTASTAKKATDVTKKAKKTEVSMKPFSQLALGGGVSLMGVNLQAATNVNRYLNLRATGNVFNYTANDISTNGFNIDAKINMATAGASLDYYPFPTHGFRLSPGVQFYNQNMVSANIAVESGTSFSLNDVDFYSSSTNPVQGTARIGLHSQNPAFTFTTGWGNMINRKGKHLSFPFELGVAVVNSPTVDIALTQGEVCDSTGVYCTDVTTDTTVQSNLKAEVAKYKNDLDPLKVYPILSFGVAYSFGIR